jgi:hypothetical protein
MAMAVKLVQMGQVHCLGWSRARLVHDSHLRAWQLTFGCKDAPAPKIEDGILKPSRADPDQHATGMTYQWLDIYGQVNEEEFKLSCNSILGHIYMRPGINESVLRSLVAKIFGRHEINYVLQALLDRGVIRRFCGDLAASPRLGLPVVGLAALEDEKLISYMAEGIMQYI